MLSKVQKAADERMAKFVAYVMDFYGGPDAVYPMGATEEQVKLAVALVRAQFGRLVYDSVDRERVRDQLIKTYGLVFPVG